MLLWGKLTFLRPEPTLQCTDNCKSSHQKQIEQNYQIIFISRIYAASSFYAGFYMQKLVFKATN